jgi:hypothetical protein
MGITKGKAGVVKKPRKPRRYRQASFRDLKAFGIWADRTDLKHPVQFTKELRTRMERGDDGR